MWQCEVTLPIAPGENARGRQGARLRATSSWARLSSLGHLPLPCPANMPRAFTSAFAHITSSSDYCSNPPLFLALPFPMYTPPTEKSDYMPGCASWLPFPRNEKPTSPVFRADIFPESLLRKQSRHARPSPISLEMHILVTMHLFSLLHLKSPPSCMGWIVSPSKKIHMLQSSSQNGSVCEDMVLKR